MGLGGPNSSFPVPAWGLPRRWSQGFTRKMEMGDHRQQLKQPAINNWI